MKVIKIFRLTTFAFILAIGSCTSNKPIYLNNQFGSFDIKNNNIVFTYYQNNIGSIYLYSLLDNSIKRMTNPKIGWDDMPQISNDGKRILYLCYPNPKEQKYFLNILNIESQKTDTLLKGEPLILEACFSIKGEYIYYTKAVEFKNYSPMAKAAPHGVDLFEIEINSKHQRQITNLKEYSMQVITQTYSDSLLGINIPNAEYRMGMGLLSLKNGEFIRYKFQNDPRYQVNSWYFPIAIRKDSLLYSAPYEIYIHNFIENRSKFIFRNPDNNNFGKICVDESWDNLYFKLAKGIFRYNIKSKELTNFNIRITN